MKPLYYPIHLQAGNLCTLGSTKLKRHLYGQFLQFRTFASFFSVASILECRVEKQIECNTIQDSRLILQHCRPFDMVYKCNHTCLQFSQKVIISYCKFWYELEMKNLQFPKSSKQPNRPWCHNSDPWLFMIGKLLNGFDWKIPISEKWRS